jgi:hypothetical protein
VLKWLPQGGRNAHLTKTMLESSVSTNVSNFQYIFYVSSKGTGRWLCLDLQHYNNLSIHVDSEIESGLQRLHGSGRDIP